MPIGSSMSVQNAVSAIRTVQQGETFTANVKSRARILSLTSANTFKAIKSALKLAILATPGEAITLPNRLVTHFVTVLSPHNLLAVVGGGKAFDQIILIFQAQLEDPIQTFQKIITFVTGLGGANQYLQFASIFQGQTITLIKAVPKRALMLSGNIIPVMGSLGRAGIITALISSVELLTKSAKLAHLALVTLAETVTLPPRSVGKIIAIASQHILTSLRIMGSTQVVLSTQVLLRLNTVTKRLTTVTNAESLTLTSTKAKIITLVSALTFSITRKNLTKLVRVAWAETINFLKPFSKVTTITWDEAVQLILPPGGRAQNVIASITSSQLFSFLFADFHFVIINALHPIIHTINSAVLKQAFTFRNILGVTAPATTFTAPALTVSRNVSGSSFRQIIPLNELIVAGNQIAVTFKNAVLPSAGPCQIVGAFVGEQGTGNDFDFDGNQVQLTFGGVGTGTVPLSGSLTSDFISFSVAANKSLVIAVDIPSSGAGLDANINTADTNFRVWAAAYSGSTAQNTVGPTMTQNVHSLWGISAIASRTDNVSVSKALAKQPFSLLSAELAQLIKTPPAKVFSITSGETVTKAAIRARNQSVAYAHAVTLAIARAVGKLIAYGFVFSPRTFNPAFGINTTLAQVARQVIPASQLVSGTGSPIAITFSNLFGANPCTFIAAYVGEQGTAGDASFDGNQVQLFVNGQSSFVVPKGGTVTTDLTVLSIANAVPLVVSWEFSGGNNSIDALQNQDSGFHFWNGGPSGSAGSTGQPGMAESIGVLAGVASVGAPQQVTMPRAGSRAVAILSPLLAPILKTAQKIANASSTQQIRTGPTSVNKFMAVIHEHIVTIVQTFSRFGLTGKIGQSTASISVISRVQSILSGSTITTFLPRQRIVSITQVATTTVVNGVQTLIPIIATALTTAAEVARHSKVFALLGGSQLIAQAGKAIQSSIAVSSAHTLTAKSALARAVSLTAGHALSLINTVTPLISIGHTRSIVVLRQLTGHAFLIHIGQVPSTFRSAKAKFVTVAISSAQAVTVALPSVATSVISTLRIPQALATVRAGATTIYRLVAGSPDSNNIQPGNPND